MRGFTLVELIVVMLLIGIVGVALLAALPGRQINLGAAAEQLASDVRLVQSLSMTAGTRHCLNLAATSYAFARNACTTPVAHPAQGATAAPIALDPGISLGWSGLPGDLLTFSGRGEPFTDAAATTPLAAEAVITLTADGLTRTVRVTPATGRVRVQ